MSDETCDRCGHDEDYHLQGKYKCCSQFCTCKSFQYSIKENDRPTSLPDNDPVNHPSHYTSHPSGVECLTIIRHMNFNLGNAIKYIWRSGLKNTDNVEDLRKAVFYIQDEIKKLEGTI